MRYWLFNMGTAAKAPPRDWLERWTTHDMYFPKNKRPRSIHQGDRAVINGSQRTGLIAAVEITSSEPEERTAKDDREKESVQRWPYKLDFRILLAKPADDHFASLEGAGFNPMSVRRQSHIEIDAEQYERAVKVLAKAAADSALRS